MTGREASGSAVPFVILVSPLVGAIVLWALGPLLKSRSGLVASFAVLVSFIAAISGINRAFAPAPAAGAIDPSSGMELVTWISGIHLGLILDPLTLLWTLIITGIGFLITVYSIGYMDGDSNAPRFFAYMNFFVFAMLALVLSDNFAGLLIGWGLVGAASYLLIGYYIFKPSAVAAARKAFILNVVGDVGLLYAVFVIYDHVNSVGYSDVFTSVSKFDSGSLFLAVAGLLVAVCAKSAQIPLFTWLPDAMEGPTPVSALIHAATMVTAGVYLVARCAPLWNASPQAQELTGWIGGLTLLAGAVLGCVQWDIKRILAYSTMSQIGYMVMGVGVGAYSAGVMHFYTHAFFKALMFLTAGLVIHALHDEQDVRRMGGLSRSMPFAFWCMLIGVIAITGILPVGGFFSKDAVLEGTLAHGHYLLYAIGVFTAGLTSYYMFRMLFLTFFGDDRSAVSRSALGMDGEDHAAAHHAAGVPAWVMQAPVGALAAGTLVCGLAAVAWGGEPSAWTRLLGSLFPAVAAGEEHLPFSETVAIGLTLSVSVLGIIAAYLRYGAPNAPVRQVAGIASEASGIPAVLRRRFYVDDAIDLLFVAPAVRLGHVIAGLLEPRLIDGLVRDAVWLVNALGMEVRALQNGLVRSYAFLMVGGVVVALAYFAWLGAPR